MILREDYLTTKETKDLFAIICNYETGIYKSKKQLYTALLSIFYDNKKIKHKDLNAVYDIINKEL